MSICDGMCCDVNSKKEREEKGREFQRGSVENAYGDTCYLLLFALACPGDCVNGLALVVAGMHMTCAWFPPVDVSRSKERRKGRKSPGQGEGNGEWINWTAGYCNWPWL